MKEIGTEVKAWLELAFFVGGPILLPFLLMWLATRSSLLW